MTDIDKLKQTADGRMLEVIGHYVTLHKQGKDHVGLCPFHQDTKPSLKVSTEKGLWRCFACGAKGKGAVSFVEAYEHTENEFATTMRHVAAILNEASPETGRIRTDARRTLEAPVKKIAFDFKDWTAEELFLLGSPPQRDEKGEALRGPDGRPIPEWTGNEMETVFNLYSVASYVMPPGDGKEKSCRYHSSPTYPIFTYKYPDGAGGEWGRIYMPFAPRNQKFFYWPTGSERTKDPVFADRRLNEHLQRALADPKFVLQEKFDHVLICSGGSDAINAYQHLPELLGPKPAPSGEEGEEIERAAKKSKVHVCWLGSETSGLSRHIYDALKRVARILYICYDQDETGRRQMYRIAMQYLDIRVVNLPIGMAASTDGRCKDIKDYFKSYFHDGRNLDQKKWYFGLCLHTSLSLRFWEHKTNRDGKSNGKYNLLLENMRQFINANGIYTYITAGNARNFVQLDANRVNLMPADEVETSVRNILVSFLRSSYEYFDGDLIETINRSKLMSERNMRMLSPIQLNFHYDASRQEYLFFRNGVFRVTPTDIEKVRESDIDFYIFNQKVIDHSYEPGRAPFHVEYSGLYHQLKNERDTFTAYSAEWHEANNRLTNLPDVNRYRLVWDEPLTTDTLSFIQYLYNTGRMYWRQEQRGEPLTEQQQREYDLHFINKCWSLGYLLRHHKREDQAIAIHALEYNIIASGQSEGRTGKSLFGKALRALRSTHEIDMRITDIEKKGDTLFSGVEENITDVVVLEDMKRGQSVGSIFNAITGDMAVRKLHKDPVYIPFRHSPKMYLISNFAPKMDGSTRGRLNFIAFSNYYHADNPAEGLREFSPSMEFGKNMISDYTVEEMNQLYNFFAACIQLNMQFPDKIEPVMENIELRTLIEDLSPNVYDWMNDYFDEGATLHPRVNVPIWRDDMYEDYRRCAFNNREFAARASKTVFKERVAKFCANRGWELNPDILYRSDVERNRKEYRKGRAGKDDFFWYIKTRDIAPEMIEAFHEKKVEPKGTAGDEPEKKQREQ